MKLFKEGVLIKKGKELLELISFYDTVTNKYGINVYFHDKLVEIIQPLNEEPLRNEMQYPWKYSFRYPWKYSNNQKR